MRDHDYCIQTAEYEHCIKCVPPPVREPTVRELEDEWLAGHETLATRKLDDA